MGRAALILAVVAVMGIWGGPAIAAKLITGKEVKDRSLTGKDLKSNSVTGRVAAGLSGRDILSDSIDGTDVLESSLAPVPNARNADNANAADRADLATRAERADAVNGTRPYQLDYAKPVNGEATTFFDAGGLKLRGRCTGAGLLSVTASTSTAAAGGGWVRVWGSTRNQGPQPFHQEDDDFRPGEEFNVLAGGDDNVGGSLAYTGPDGFTVTASFLAESGVAGRPYACLFAGTAILASP